MPNVSLPARALAAASLAGLVLGVAAFPASAAKKAPCRTSCTGGTADTTAPAVAVSSPAAGSTVAGTVTVSGSASDNAGVAQVQVAVDGGALAPASGTSAWSWSWATTGYANGTHVLKAVVTDTSGNVSSASVSVNVSNPVPDTTAPSVAVSSPVAGSTVAGTVTVGGSASDNVGVARVDVAVDGGAWSAASGTGSWTWSWATAGLANGSHTVSARAVDGAGNASATASVTVNVSNGSTTTPPPPSGTTAPSTQGSWVSPEGVHINVTTAGPFTIAKIYDLLRQNALDLSTIGPHLTINVQDQYSSQTQSSGGMTNGVYTSASATMYLKGVNSTFASYPDWILAHEYGHAWSNYWLYMAHNGDWSSYLNKRWTAADGSVVLATDSRLDSAYSWTRGEIIAEDYRLLFGSSTAVSQQPSHMNTSIPNPNNVAGLKDFMLNTWR